MPASYAFAVEMQEGDIVVMPRKLSSQIAIGRVAGPYRYQNVGGRYRHTRPVKWERPDVSRTAFEQDLLTGARPFTTTSGRLLDVERATVRDPAPAPSAVVTDRREARRLRGDLDRIVLMALRPEPDRRYRAAGELADDVARHLAGLPVRAQPDSLGYRARKFVARNRALVASAVLVAVLLLGFGIASAVQARRVALERDRALDARRTADAVIGMLTDLFERSNPRIVPGGDTVRVAALLEEGERRVSELTTEPVLQARMWRVLGNMHAARSRFDRAEDLLRRAYERQRAIAGEDDSTAAEIYHELARAVNEHRGPAAALPMFDSSLALLRRIHGPWHPSVAIAFEERSAIDPDVERRIALLDSAARIRARLPVVDSITLAATLNRRGTLAFSQSRWAEARTSFEASLAILDRLLPPDHANRLAVQGNVITILDNTGEFERADSLWRLQLDALRRTVGPTSVDYAGALENSAVNAFNRGRFEEAEARIRTVLATYRRALAPDHWRIENALRNLGQVIARGGRADEGLAVFDSALAMQRARSDTVTDDLGLLTGERSYLLLLANRVPEAVAAAREAERILRARGRQDDSREGNLEFWLAATSFASGDTASAVTHFTRARDVYAKTLPATHPTVAMTECALGAALAGVGRRQEAEPLLRDACARHERWGAKSTIVSRWGRDAAARLAGGAS